MTVFERKVPRKIYGVYFNAQTNSWKKILQRWTEISFSVTLYLKKVFKSRLVWAVHAWRKQDTLIRKVIEKNLGGKKHFGEHVYGGKIALKSMLKR